MNEYENVRALEKNLDAVLSHVLNIERELKDPGSFVCELMDTVGRMEQRNGTGILDR